MAGYVGGKSVCFSLPIPAARRTSCTSPYAPGSSFDSPYCGIDTSLYKTFAGPVITGNARCYGIRYQMLAVDALADQPCAPLRHVPARRPDCPG